MPDQATVQDSLIGLEFGHYRILERVGSGGMGVVYRGYDAHLEREVAIKVLNTGTIADDHSRKRFRNEAHALSQLNHPNVATIHDFDTHEGRDFLVMEYIQGVNLTDKLASGALPEEEVFRLGEQLCDGLTAAHRHGVVHRDLKPGNLRLTSDGRLKILDFGLAKLRQSILQEGETATTLCSMAFAGTLPYMAPEQLTGDEVDARTDIYGAGLVLYEMATGQRPYAELRSGKLFGAILQYPPTPLCQLNPRVSPEFERIVGKCLQKEPALRYQSAQELAQDLGRVQTRAPNKTKQVFSLKEKRSLVRPVVLGTGFLVSVIALLVAYNTITWRNRVSGSTDPPRIDSLAVLPLVNLSGDPQQDYFADGMTDELISNLGKVASLRVISRTSVMQYKESKKSLPTIAEELHVDAVVEGSVQRAGNRVRIIATLIQAKSDRHIWAESYERDASDILALQGEVAQAIAGQIQAKITPQEHRLLATAAQVDPAAHEAYLLGRYHWNKMTEDELKKARTYFEQSVARDPGYAPPYSGLADYYTETYEFMPGVALDKAKSYAEKALSLDETLAEAHLSLADVHYSMWDWPAAEREYRRALELNPNFAEAQRRYAVYLSALGREQEAWETIHAAQQLDPLSVTITTSAGWVSYFSRHYDQAAEQCKNALALDPNSVNAHDCLGSVYLAAGKYEQAIAACQSATALSGGDPDRAVCLGRAYAAAGKTAEARRLLNELSQASRRRYVPPYFLATLHAALGENDQAFGWLENGYRQRDPYFVWIKTGPELDSLRADPRMDTLVRRLGFPD